MTSVTYLAGSLFILITKPSRLAKPRQGLWRLQRKTAEIRPKLEIRVAEASPIASFLIQIGVIWSQIAAIGIWIAAIWIQIELTSSQIAAIGTWIAAIWIQIDLTSIQIAATWSRSGSILTQINLISIQIAAIGIWICLIAIILVLGEFSIDAEADSYTPPATQIGPALPPRSRDPPHKACDQRPRSRTTAPRLTGSGKMPAMRTKTILLGPR